MELEREEQLLKITFRLLRGGGAGSEEVERMEIKAKTANTKLFNKAH